ncbi:MAG: hypothetical protein H0V29_06995 [Thermoleophilaceae bacterium]|nr:hypothetical protein [Thermoleophilaceae bacterium]
MESRRLCSEVVFIGSGPIVVEVLPSWYSVGTSATWLTPIAFSAESALAPAGLASTSGW